MKSFLLLVSMVFMCATSTSSQTIRYVKPGATGDGSSWVNASGDLQATINASGNGDQVWVAAGTYKPTTGTNQNASFIMKNGVAIYGGFNGTEAQLNLRNFTTNQTTLSGDLNGNDVVNGTDGFFTISNNGENSFRVIHNNFTSGSPLTASAVLDGFTIKGANGVAGSNGGSGITNVNASPTLTNLVFTANYGGIGAAMFNFSGASPVITNVRFLQNLATGDAGAVYNLDNSNPVFTNVVFTANRGGNSILGGGAVLNLNSSPAFNSCQFSGNVATDAGAISNIGCAVVVNNCVFLNNSVTGGGGCLYIENSNLQIINSTFSGNRSTLYAGVMYVRSSVVNAVNCVFWNNTAGAATYSNSGVLASDGTNPVVTIKNSIIWNNQSVAGGVQPQITNSIVQGGYTGTGNLNLSPRFVNDANNNFRLQSCSPAIDAGSNAAIPLGITTDADGNPRIFGATVDMGAYELQQAPLPVVSTPPITTNNALSFDGVNDYAMLVRSCGNGNPIVNGGDAITIEYWFKGSVLQSAVRLQPDNDNYIVSGHFGEHILSNDGGFATGNGLPVGANATDGNWHHVAMTWQRGTVNGFKSYLDGVLVAQRNAANTPLPVVDGGAYLGAFNGNAQFMNGSLDEVRIWNVARTQAQIQAGLCGISLPQTGLLALYTFDHGTANGNNTGLAPGLRNLAQTDYYNGLLSGFAFNGTTSNWVNINRTLRVYVNANQTPAVVDGLSWQSAFTNLQDALNYSCNSSDVEIWVAEGTYKPTRDPFGNANPADPRDRTFFVRDGLKIYGGFAGTETSLSQRVTGAHPTVLSGDIDNNDVLDNGNAYHVVVAVAPTSNAKGILFNGCTVTGGNANGTGFIDVSFNSVRRSTGGGILLINGPNTISNNIFSANAASSRAGAMSVSQGTQSIINNYFSNNNAPSGGALFLASSISTLIGNRFAANSAGNGGAVTVDGGTTGFTNNVFVGNAAGSDGGGVYADFSTATFTNNSFSGNTASRGGAVFNSSSTLTYTNNIIWGNGGSTAIGGSNNTVTYSVVQGGFTGTGNLNVDPLFVQQPSIGLGTTGNLRLRSCSPAVNMGSNAALPQGITTDIDGSSRIFNNATVDMGAFELQRAPVGVTNIDTTVCGPYNWIYFVNNEQREDIITQSGNYSKTLVSVDGCDSVVNLTLTVNNITGDPLVFGNNTWNVYGFNSGNGTLAGTDWSTNYRGYYTSTNLNINTGADWDQLTSPAQATTYKGCSIANDNHSYSAKRQGFPCGYYSIDVPVHDDAAQLFVNDIKVWEHDGCCDEHISVWSGWLGANDRVEYRISEGGGGSVGLLSFNKTADCVPATALSLNGNNNHLLTPEISSQFAGNDFTVELWFKPNAAGVILSELGQPTANVDYHNSQIEILSNGEVRGRVFNLDAFVIGTAAFGTWHHVVLRYNSATNKADGMLDGVVSTGSVIGERTKPANLYYAFGAEDFTHIGSGGVAFNGVMDEVRIWNRAICNEEIINNRNCQLIGGETGLVAYYQLNQGQVGINNSDINEATDASGNGYNATLNNFLLTGEASNWSGGIVSSTACAAFSSPAITSVTAINQVICSNATTDLTANGVMGTNAQLTWYTGANGTGTTLGSANPLTNVGVGTYHARVTGGCSDAVEVSFTVSAAPNTFTGSGNWSDAGRWSCGAVPGSNDAVIIDGQVALYENVIIGPQGSLLMDDDGTLTINPNKILTISGTANFGNRPVVVKSDANGTGSIGQVSGSLTGATNVTVERYLAPNTANGRTGRAWRLLTSPVTGPSLNAAWQEGMTFHGTSHVFTGTSTVATPVSGYGTNLNGAAQATAVNANGNGFDFWNVVANSTSAIRRYSIAGNVGTWANSIPSTLTTKIEDYPAYLTFIRGDRTVTTGTAGNATTLRATGTLRQGAITITQSGHPYTLVGNPFASAIDFEKIYSHAQANIQPLFWLWDANLNMTGGYRLIEREEANNYSTTPGGGTGAPGTSYQHLQSGAGFFVQPTALGGNFTINEDDKTSGLPPATVFRGTATEQRLYINLNLTGTSGTLLADGVQTRFNDGYSAAVTGEDIGKPTNINETLSLLRSQQNLMVERRPLITQPDTLFLHLANTSSRSYQFEVVAQNLEATSLTAMLEDAFTNTSSAIDLSGTTTINFTITADAASKATNRFRIVFEQPKVLPATFTNIKASQQQATVLVDWTVYNETDVKTYEIERSGNGQQFSTIGNALAKNQLTASYRHVDAQPLQGTNYYRIKQHTNDGLVRYSSVVKVVMGKGEPSVNVYPNPLTGQQFSLQLSHLPAGTYQLRLLNQAGQEVYRKAIAHGGGSAAQMVQCNTLTAKGIYQVQLLSANGERFTTQLITQ